MKSSYTDQLPRPGHDSLQAVLIIYNNGTVLLLTISTNELDMMIYGKSIKHAFKTIYSVTNCMQHHGCSCAAYMVNVVQYYWIMHVGYWILDSQVNIEYCIYIT